MAIEFRCSQCNQLLRVPDDSAGKNARCPKCQSLMTVPAASQPATSPPTAPLGGGGSPFSPMPLPSTPTPSAAAQPPKPPPGQSPFASQPAGGAGGGFPPPPSNPFAGLGTAPPPKGPGNPFGDGGATTTSTNPYASPGGGYAAYQPGAFAPPNLPITNVVVPIDPIMSHAFRVWQANLGLLVVVTVIVVALMYAIAIPQAILQAALEQNNAKEGVIAVAILGNILQQLLQIFLGIGQAQIALKVARGMPATISDLFGGGPRFLAVFAGNLIAGIALFAGVLLCIVPAILLALWFWPFYFLLVEERASIGDSFSVASRITEGNRGTTFILALCGMGIMLLGCLALCVGTIFAAPLVSVMWATAYLMMSGQLPTQPQYVKY